MIDIQITTNEPKKNYFVGALIDLGYHPMLKILPVADFVIFGQKDEEDASIVERKAASDFLNSLEGKKDKISGTWERGRLWDQLKRMKESKVKDRILIIEGNPPPDPNPPKPWWGRLWEWLKGLIGPCEESWFDPVMCLHLT